MFGEGNETMIRTEKVQSEVGKIKIITFNGDGTTQLLSLLLLQAFVQNKQGNCRYYVLCRVFAINFNWVVIY